MNRIHGSIPDYLAPDLSILFVGINPGLRSSDVGHHYAGPSNRFWKLLFESGLIPSPMSYRDDGRLLEYGYGLTNLIAKPTAGLHNLSKQDFLQGRHALVEKLITYQPALVALLGISVARTLLPLEGSKNSRKGLVSHPIQPGLQTELLEGTRIFVLPNPSGRNAHYSYQTMKDLFGELHAESVQS